MCIVVALARATAHADDALAEARRLEANLEYEKALVLVDREIARGTNDRARLIELHVLAGKLAAGIDHPDVATTHFLVALALAPQTTLPDGTSPKLAEPFDAARARSAPLHIALRREPGRVTATVDHDPAAIFAGLRVYASTGAPVTAPGATLETSAVVTAADAVDRFGNVLEHATFPPPEMPRPSPPSSPSLVGRWSTWAAIGGGALVVAGACAWRFGVAQDDWNTLDREGSHDFSALRAVEDRGRRWGLAANLGFGVTAAAGIAAVVLYVLHRDPATTSISVTGETVGLAARF